MNLPNRLTMSRLAFALAIFGILEWITRTPAEAQSTRTTLSVVGLVLFILAAITDAVDGWVARKQKIATAFGRMADPLMDKIIISGILVFLSQIESTRASVPAWMVVLVLVREFLLTGLRGLIEGSGQGFGARILGKTKMVVQCLLVGWAFVHIGFLPESEVSRGVLTALAWATLLSTIGSGMMYVPSAVHVLREAKDI